MHIATANAYNTALDQLMTRQNNLANAQEQLTSGKAPSTGASDDPAAAAAWPKRRARRRGAQHRETSAPSTRATTR